MQKIKNVSVSANPYLAVANRVDHTISNLYYRGELPNERRVSVAIVGSRKMSTYGKEVAYRLAADLAKQGVVIVSGLALGTDATAHRGALSVGGTTIAVLANGLDSVYPTSHRGLADQIIKTNGALLSEYEAGMPALAHQFLERNRIVSAISDAVVVVEAALRSGTLSTAAHALTQGKIVCAVPGNITSPTSQGCNRLIKQGAVLVSSADDILDELGVVKAANPQSSLAIGDTKEEEAILALMRDGERDGALLLENCGLSAAAFNQTVTMLEIKGVVRSLGANKWTIS